MNRQLAKQYFERAEAALGDGKPQDALALLNQLDEAFPNTKNIGVARARAYAAMGRVTEAVGLCDQLIALHDSRRAHEIKQQLLQGVLEPEPAQPAATVRAGLARSVVKWAIALTLIVGLIGGALWYSRQLETNSIAQNPHDVATANPNVRITPELPATTPQPNAAITRRANATQPAAPKPGQEHPATSWELDGSGVPIFKTGVFRQVPCINEPERTIDVYLPLAYDAKPDVLFPAVVIQMPVANPGFNNLEKWAERCEVILIVINSSKNSTFEQNAIAQDRALETIVASTLRVDQRMGFAMGMSGGGRASWQIVARYPENFRGVVMMGICGDYYYEPPLYVRVGVIHGETDFNNEAIAITLRRYRRTGYEVRERIVPGGHVKGPPHVRIEMLDWMVNAARRDLGLLLPQR